MSTADAMLHGDFAPTPKALAARANAPLVTVVGVHVEWRNVTPAGSCVLASNGIAAAAESLTLDITHGGRSRRVAGLRAAADKILQRGLRDSYGVEG